MALPSPFVKKTKPLYHNKVNKRRQIVFLFISYFKHAAILTSFVRRNFVTRIDKHEKIRYIFNGSWQGHNFDLLQAQTSFISFVLL